MPEALDAWKAKAVSEPIKLEHTGTLVRVRLPNIRACIIAGDIPMDIVAKMQAKVKTKGAEPTPDTIQDWKFDARYRAEMVRQCVVEVEGEPVALTPEDVEALDDEDRAELFLYASRVKPLPLRT
jgi:hypothetical protein